MIVAVIIAMMAALALPAFKRVRLGAQTSRISNDIRVFANSFQVYNMVNGDWPPSQGPGVIPTGMPPDFKANVWQSQTSIGGDWQWVAGSDQAGIHIVNTSASLEQMASIDRNVDDGDLGAGHFRQTTGTSYVYHVD
jgi:type II secretory pathway pseudopilin PulG